MTEIDSDTCPLTSLFKDLTIVLLSAELQARRLPRKVGIDDTPHSSRLRTIGLKKQVKFLPTFFDTEINNYEMCGKGARFRRTRPFFDRLVPLAEVGLTTPYFLALVIARGGAPDTSKPIWPPALD